MKIERDENLNEKLTECGYSTQIQNLVHDLHYTIHRGHGGISDRKRTAYAEGFLDCMQAIDMIDRDTLVEILNVVFK